MKKTIRSKFIAPLLLPLLLAGAGCHRNDVQVYTVSPDQTQPAPPLAAMPPTNAVDIAGSPAQLPPGHPDISPMQAGSLPTTSADQSVVPLTWTTPDGWISVPPSEMRVASFNVTNANGKTADVSIVPLAGMGGGDAPNVNRWRGQVGLAPTTDDRDPKLSARKMSKPPANPRHCTILAERRAASWASSNIATTIIPGSTK